MPRSTDTSSSDATGAATDATAAPEHGATGATAPGALEHSAAEHGAAEHADSPGPSAGAGDDEFVVAQRRALVAERRTYLAQAAELQAQADSLALEHEPGDVQFDEEGGEGGTSSVDRELDLLLSAQARNTVEEIDRALTKIEAGTYGRCERCGRPIPEARLEALPHAAMCVACKAGGLASRR